MTLRSWPTTNRPVLRLHLTDRKAGVDPACSRCCGETSHREPAARPAGQAAAAHRRAVQSGDLRRHRRPVAEEAHAGRLRPGQPRAAPTGLLARRLRPPRLGRPGLRQIRSTTPYGSTPARRSARRPGGSCPRASGSCRASSPTTTRSTGWPTPSTISTSAGHRRQLRVLPVDPALVLRRRLQAAGPLGPRRTRRPGPVAPGRHRETVRPRPGQRPRPQQHRRGDLPARLDLPDRPLPRQGDRPEHPGVCGSRTSCSSRSGTRTSSTTCRSRWPRTSASGAGPATTTASGRRATSSRTTCSSCLRWSGWRSRSRSTPRDLRAEKEKVLSAVRLPPDLGPAHGARSVLPTAGPAESRCRAISRRRASRPILDDRDVRSHPSRHRHPALGRVCRSTCAPASGSAAGSPRSPWCSSARRTCRSSRPRPRNSEQNALVVRVQPDEGVTMRFGSKVPGTAMEVRDVTMDFGYGHSFTEDSPEAYERLHPRRAARRPAAVPAARGGRAVLADPRSDRALLGPLRRTRAYPSGSWGPASADEMLARDGRAWRRP